jgi:hypothetical protein
MTEREWAHKAVTDMLLRVRALVAAEWLRLAKEVMR